MRVEILVGEMREMEEDGEDPEVTRRNSPILILLDTACPLPHLSVSVFQSHTGGCAMFRRNSKLVIAIAVSLLIGLVLSRAWAQFQPELRPAVSKDKPLQYASHVPRSWGKFVTVTDNLGDQGTYFRSWNLWFEDEEGTIRTVIVNFNGNNKVTMSTWVVAIPRE